MEQGYRLAAIDIGTNSVRMLVAEVKGEGVLLDLHKETRTTRIGEGLAATGRLSEEAMTRTVEAIEALKVQALELGAQRIMCYATAAVRDAENRDDFIRMTHRQTQLLVDVLPGEMEAQVSFAGVPGSGLRCTVDIGGGSTDIVLGEEDAPLEAVSLRLGAVRASELYPLGDVADSLTLMAMKQWAAKWMRDELETLAAHASQSEHVDFYGVGGTCTTLAAIAQKMEQYDASRVHGYVLTRQTVEEIMNRLVPLPLEERKRVPGLAASRADIIIGGTVILAAFMDRLAIDSITVSEQDNLEGYILMRLKQG